MLSALPLPQRNILKLIREEAINQGIAAYLVGGIVRDLYLGYPATDIDIVFEADAIRFARHIHETHGGTLVKHPQFINATWKTPGGISLDLITARSETYPYPAALPVVTASTLAEDLARRDFTINTLALRLSDNELIDIHNSLPDLQNGIIRVLHAQSFRDDPTRILRAIRYEQRYGFSIEPQTLEWLQTGLSGLRLLSAERFRHELDRILDEPRAPRTLLRAREMGVLQDVLDWDDALFPALDSVLQAPFPPEWLRLLPESVSQFRQQCAYSLLLTALTPEQWKKLQPRLYLPRVCWLSARAAATLWAELPGLSGYKPSEWVRRLEDVPLPALWLVSCLGAEDVIGQYVGTWKDIQPHTTGETLQNMGLTPGPQFKNILWRLRSAWLDGEISSPEAETKLLKGLL